MFEQIDDDDDVISELFQHMTSSSLCRVGGYFYKQLLKKNDRFLFLKMRNNFNCNTFFCVSVRRMKECAE